MAYKFKAEGFHSADLPQENVKAAYFHTETPRTNDGRGTDTAVTMKVVGAIRSVDEGTLASITSAFLHRVFRPDFVWYNSGKDSSSPASP